jgi:hypothetical protein
MRTTNISTWSPTFENRTQARALGLFRGTAVLHLLEILEELLDGLPVLEVEIVGVPGPGRTRSKRKVLLHWAVMFFVIAIESAIRPRGNAVRPACLSRVRR